MSRLRKRLDCLSESEIARLAEAFRALMAKRDATSNYAFWAGIHGTSCPHKCEQFLPWHRAYLVEFETALQQAIGDPAVMLPYWNWTVIRGIPAWLDRPPFASTRDPKRPDDLPPAREVQQVLRLTRFDDFGGGLCPTSYPGGLENTHSTVHNWVGGLMLEAKTAAQDPLFWLHHAYVDALWLQWQQTHTEAPLALDAVLPGVPGRWTVRETLNVRSPRLDYDYITCESDHSLDDWAAGEEPKPLGLRVPPHVTAIRFIARGITAHGRPPAALVLTNVDGARVTLSLFGLGHHHGRHDDPHHPSAKEESGAAGWLFLEGDITRGRDLPLRLAIEWADPRVDPAARGHIHVRSLTVQMVDALVARPV